MRNSGKSRAKVTIFDMEREWAKKKPRIDGKFMRVDVTGRKRVEAAIAEGQGLTARQGALFLGELCRTIRAPESGGQGWRGAPLARLCKRV